MIIICGIKPQPSLRDLTVDPSAPGVETPGYFHDVPPGQKHGLRPALADQILASTAVSNPCGSCSSDHVPYASRQALHDSLHRQEIQSQWISQEDHAVAAGAPHRFAGGGPQDQTREADGRGQVRYAGVVADKTGTRL